MPWKSKPAYPYMAEVGAAVLGSMGCVALSASTPPGFGQTVLAYLAGLAATVASRFAYLALQQTRIDRVMQQAQHEAWRRRLSWLKAQPPLEAKVRDAGHDAAQKAEGEGPRHPGDADALGQDHPGEGHEKPQGR